MIASLENFALGIQRRRNHNARNACSLEVRVEKGIDAARRNGELPTSIDTELAYQKEHPPQEMALQQSSVVAEGEVAEGKIRLIGLSNVTQEHIERARRIVPIVSVQNRYSFADREWDYVVDYCNRNGIAFIPWFPLGAGRVRGQTLDQLARAHKATPHQVAIAWLLKRAPIMLPIPGTSSVKHLEENVAAAALQLSDEENKKASRVPQLAATRS